jgi:hypothetical protein
MSFVHNHSFVRSRLDDAHRRFAAARSDAAEIDRTAEHLTEVLSDGLHDKGYGDPTPPPGRAGCCRVSSGAPGCGRRGFRRGGDGG